MAGRARGSSRPILCAALAAWVAVVQRTVCAEGFPVSGVGCVLFDSLQQEKIMTDIPPDVYLTLERRDLVNEYYKLTDTLFEAPKGTLGNWKSSALAQSIHIKGHDAIFEAKNVSLFVTRKDGEVGSKINLCVVDRVREPTFFPPDIYAPGKSVPFMLEGSDGCRVSNMICARLRRHIGRLPEGVYGQSFHGRSVESDKVRMPVELMKFLDRKDAVGVNMEMAAMVNTGERTTLDAASVVRSFQSQFLAKGVRVFFALAGLHLKTCSPSIVFGRETCKVRSDWAEWLEYADAAVVNASYRPGGPDDWEYPASVVDSYDGCRSGNLELLRTNARLKERNSRRTACKKVAGAEARAGKKFPDCKCRDENSRVYCGLEAVGERKFNVDALRKLPACQAEAMYCSARACHAPFRMVPMEP